MTGNKMPKAIPGYRMIPPHKRPGSEKHTLLEKLRRKRRGTFQKELDIHVLLTEIEDGLVNVSEVEFRNSIGQRIRRMRKLIANTNKKKLDDYPNRIKKCWANLREDWQDKNEQKKLDTLLDKIIGLLESDSH